MEMVPRKRGRPRKLLDGLITVTPDGMIPNSQQDKTSTDSIHSDRLKLLEKRLADVENEKKELIKQLEDNALKSKGIDTQSLISKPILSKTEIDRIKSEINFCDKVLRDSNDVLDQKGPYTVSTDYSKFQDKSEVIRTKVRLQKALASSSAPVLSDVERARLMERKNELDTYLKRRYEAIGDRWNRNDSYEFQRTVENIVALESECASKIAELKNINKILFPDDPRASKLGYLQNRVGRNV